jgi:peptidoglycan/LPS O-acetylase OafA/YrhL
LVISEALRIDWAELKPRFHYYCIDILRIFAAGMVMLNHFSIHTWNITSALAIGNGRAVPSLMGFRGVGAVGVEIFFVISGFAISMSAAGLTGAKGAMHFLQMRTIRIAPVLWISTLIAFAALLFFGIPLNMIAPAFLRSMILLPIGPWIDGVVWTLIVEAVFYIMVAAVIFMTPKWRLETLAIGLGFFSAAYIFTLLVLTLLPHDRNLMVFMDRYFFKALMFRHGVFFAIGMILWSIRSQGVTPLKAACLLVFGAAGLIESGLMTERALPYMVAAALIWFSATAFMFWGVLCGDWINKTVGASAGLLRFLGNLSYPLYLNHYTTGSVVVMTAVAAGFAPTSSTVIGIATAIGLSCVLVVVEKPIQQAWKSRWLNSAGKTKLSTR